MFINLLLKIPYIIGIIQIFLWTIKLFGGNIELNFMWWIVLIIIALILIIIFEFIKLIVFPGGY